MDSHSINIKKPTVSQPTQPEAQNNQVMTACNKAVIEYYKNVNTNWTYLTPETCEKFNQQKVEGWTFEIIELGGRNNTFAVLWNGANQSTFIEDLKRLTETKLVIECRAVSMLARLTLIHTAVGNQAFNGLYNKAIKDFGSKFNATQQLSFNSFDQKLFAETVNASGKIAFVAYVNVISKIMLLKPSSDAMNHNVIKLMDGTYLGFSPTFFQKPRTLDDLARFMYGELTNEKFLEPSRKAIHERMVTQLTFDKYKEERDVCQNQQGYSAIFRVG